jgi:hypothetical protein
MRARDTTKNRLLIHRAAEKGCSRKLGCRFYPFSKMGKVEGKVGGDVDVVTEIVERHREGTLVPEPDSAAEVVELVPLDEGDLP